jgi:hypothetical protein
MITYTSITYQGNSTWRFKWNATVAGFYRPVMNGIAQGGAITDTTFDFNHPGFTDYPPPLEMADGDELVLSEVWPPYLVFQWYAVYTCKQYDIDEHKSSWVRLTTVLENGRLPAYTFQTMTLVDGSTHEYRLMAEDSIGQQSAARLFNVFVVTPPVLVETSFIIAYDSGTQHILVEAA